jgi:fatty-acyl-CoA synthase
MADTVQQLLRERIDDPGPAVKFGERVWTWREHLDDAAVQAAALIALADPARPLHVGTLLANTPAMLTAMAAAGLGGYVLCGINNTRRGEALARDIGTADCQILLIDAAHRGLLEGVQLPGVRVIDVDSPDWAALLAGAGALTEHREVAPTDTFMLIFTSGTSGEPKAVQVAHMMIPFSGVALVQRFSITAADVCYLSMPLFHSNALLAGWSVALSSGAAMVPADFSASGLLADLRRYGVTYLNYVGKPLAYVLATPEGRDDRDNLSVGCNADNAIVPRREQLRVEALCVLHRKEPALQLHEARDVALLELSEEDFARTRYSVHARDGRRHA